MTYTIEMLMNRIKTGEKQYDTEKILSAYEFAEKAHQGQTRTSGEPYISHPVAVAYILLEMCMDTDTLCAALLHDVVEDTGVTLDTLKKKFGDDVALLVDGVTKIGQVPLNTKEEQHAENIRKILMAMSKDIRVIIIKLADRLHNMRTLACRPPEKQRKTSLETMSFYAPIAHRLGMNDVKEEMEDVALYYLDPYGYKEVENALKARMDKGEGFIENIKKRIGERITDINPPPVIEGRVKSIYSIYKKVYVKGKNIEEIYDIFAVRIIVHSIVECYNVLGIVHDMFRPIPYRFKDYIATKKPNGYQSLHTTVIGRDGIPFEIQIRTAEMHITAQYGIAAHWKYKAGLGKKVAGEQRFDWIRQILEQQQESDDVELIAEAVKVDLAPDEVYVFTPKGDVVTLPLGSTVIDFAYAIHTQVGNRMTGAKVGGRMATFDYQLKTGDIVEVMTTNSPNYGPNRHWLDIVKTNEAKGKIRAWFKKECRSENIARGKAAFDAEMKKNNIYPDEEFLKQIAARQHFDHVDDFYAAIGYGGVILSKIVQKTKEDYLKLQKPKPTEPVLPDYEAAVNETIAKKQSSGVIVDGISGCEVHFARCCNPLPGDDIIGFVTKGFGVSVHKLDCKNVTEQQSNQSNSERWISVKWATSAKANYEASLEIIAQDRTALIADISTAIASNRIPIHEINAHNLKNGNASVLVTLEISGLEQLKNMIVKLRKIEGVITVERTGR